MDKQERMKFFKLPHSERQEILKIETCEEDHYIVISESGGYECADCGCQYSIEGIKKDLKASFGESWREEWKRLKSLKNKFSKEGYNKARSNMTTINHTNEGLTRTKRIYE